ncbi:hypothetical protein LTR70_006774 [Exophiala xenobiotica]|nr:hypothetical protein LTR70_006774 [Exophiala xenobiotica]
MACSTSPSGSTGCTTINQPLQHPCPQYINCQHPAFPDPLSTLSDSLPLPLPTPSTIPPGHAVAPFWHPVNSVHHKPAPVPTCPTSAPNHPAPPPSFPLLSLAHDPVVLVNNTRIDLSGIWCIPLLFLLVCAASLAGWQVLKWRASKDLFAPTDQPDLGFPYCECMPEDENNGYPRLPRLEGSTVGQDRGETFHTGSGPEHSSNPDPGSNHSTVRPALRRRSRTSSLRSRFQHAQALQDLYDQNERTGIAVLTRLDEIRQEQGHIPGDIPNQDEDDRILNDLIVQLMEVRSRRRRPVPRFATAAAGEARDEAPSESQTESEHGLDAYAELPPSPVDDPGRGYVESQEVEDVNGYLTGDEREDRAQGGGRHRQTNRPDHENISVYHYFEPPLVLSEPVESHYPEDLDDDVDGYARCNTRHRQTLCRTLPDWLIHGCYGQQPVLDAKCDACRSSHPGISSTKFQPPPPPYLSAISAGHTIPGTNYTCMCMHSAPQDGSSVPQREQTLSLEDNHRQTRPRQRLARTIQNWDFRGSDGQRLPNPHSNPYLQCTEASTDGPARDAAPADTIYPPPQPGPRRGAISAESIAPDTNTNTSHTCACILDVPTPYYREDAPSTPRHRQSMYRDPHNRNREDGPSSSVPQQHMRHQSLSPPRCTTCHEVGRQLCLFCGPTEERHLTQPLATPDNTYHIRIRQMARHELLNEIERFRHAVLLRRIGRLRGVSGQPNGNHGGMTNIGCTQYITQGEMQRSLHGTPEPRRSDPVFDEAMRRECDRVTPRQGQPRGSIDDEHEVEDEDEDSPPACLTSLIGEAPGPEEGYGSTPSAASVDRDSSHPRQSISTSHIERHPTSRSNGCRLTPVDETEVGGCSHASGDASASSACARCHPRLQGNRSIAAYGTTDTRESSGDVRPSGLRGGGSSQLNERVSSNVGSAGRQSSGVRQTNDSTRAAPRLQSFLEAHNLDKQHRGESDAASLVKKLCKQHESTESGESQSKGQDRLHPDKGHRSGSKDNRYDQDGTTSLTGATRSSPHRSRSSPAQAYSTTGQLTLDPLPDLKRHMQILQAAAQTHISLDVLEQIVQSGPRAEPPAPRPSVKSSERRKEESSKSTTARSTLNDDSSHVAVYKSPVTGTTKNRREKFAGVPRCGSSEASPSLSPREKEQDEPARPTTARSAFRDLDKCSNVAVAHFPFEDTTDCRPTRHSDVVRRGKLTNTATESMTGKSSSPRIGHVHVPHVVQQEGSYAPALSLASSFNPSDERMQPRIRSQSLTPEHWKKEAERLKFLADAAASTKAKSNSRFRRQPLPSAVSDDQPRPSDATAAQAHGQSYLFPVPLPASNEGRNSPHRPSRAVARPQDQCRCSVCETVHRRGNTSRGRNGDDLFDIDSFPRHQRCQCPDPSCQNIHHKTERLSRTGGYGHGGGPAPTTQTGFGFDGPKAAEKSSNTRSREKRRHRPTNLEDRRKNELTVGAVECKGKNKHIGTPPPPNRHSWQGGEEEEARRSHSTPRHNEPVEEGKPTQGRMTCSLRGGGGNDDVDYQDRNSRTLRQQPSVHDAEEDDDDDDDWETTSEGSSVDVTDARPGEESETAQTEAGGDRLEAEEALTRYFIDNGVRRPIEEASVGWPPAHQTDRTVPTPYSSVQDEGDKPSPSSSESARKPTQHPATETVSLTRNGASNSIDPTLSALIARFRSLTLSENYISDLRPNAPVSTALHHQDLFSPPRIPRGPTSPTLSPLDTIFENPIPSQVPSHTSECGSDQEVEDHTHVHHRLPVREAEQWAGDSDFEPATASYHLLTRDGRRLGPVQIPIPAPTRREPPLAPSREQPRLETNASADTETETDEPRSAIHRSEYPDPDPHPHHHPRCFPLERLPPISPRRGRDGGNADSLQPNGALFLSRDGREPRFRACECPRCRYRHIADLEYSGSATDSGDELNSDSGNDTNDDDERGRGEDHGRNGDGDGQPGVTWFPEGGGHAFDVVDLLARPSIPGGSSSPGYRRHGLGQAQSGSGSTGDDASVAAASSGVSRRRTQTAPAPAPPKRLPSPQPRCPGCGQPCNACTCLNNDNDNSDVSALPSQTRARSHSRLYQAPVRFQVLGPNLHSCSSHTQHPEHFAATSQQQQQQHNDDDAAVTTNSNTSTASVTLSPTPTPTPTTEPSAPSAAITPDPGSIPTSIPTQATSDSPSYPAHILSHLASTHARRQRAFRRHRGGSSPAAPTPSSNLQGRGGGGGGYAVNVDVDLDSLERDGPVVAFADAYACACADGEGEGEGVSEDELLPRDRERDEDGDGEGGNDGDDDRGYRSRDSNSNSTSKGHDQSQFQSQTETGTHDPIPSPSVQTGNGKSEGLTPTQTRTETEPVSPSHPSPSLSELHLESGRRADLNPTGLSSLCGVHAQTQDQTQLRVRHRNPRHAHMNRNINLAGNGNGTCDNDSNHNHNDEAENADSYDLEAGSHAQHQADHDARPRRQPSSHLPSSSANADPSPGLHPRLRGGAGSPTASDREYSIEHWREEVRRPSVDSYMDYWRSSPLQTTNAPSGPDPDPDPLLDVDVDDFGAGDVDVDADMIEIEDNTGAGAGAASSSSLRSSHLNYPRVNQDQDHGSFEEQMRSTEAFVGEHERHHRPDQDAPRIQTQTQLLGVSPARGICPLCQQCSCRDQGRRDVRAPPASMLMHRGERGGAPGPSPTLTSTRPQAQAQGHGPDPRRTDSPVPRPRVDYVDDAPRAFVPFYQAPPRAGQDTDADTASVQSMTELNAYLTWEKKMKRGSRENPVSIWSDSGSSGDGHHGLNARNRNRAEIQTQSSHPGLELEVEGKFESGLEPDTDTELEPQLEPTSPISMSSHPSSQLQTRLFSQTQAQT